jgi:predicted RNase H-like HicB family nuclease
MMIALRYSLVIEATEDPNFFGFHSPDLQGFTGVGHSVEDCLYKARWGMEEHVEALREQGLPVPPENRHPRVVIENERRAARSA